MGELVQVPIQERDAFLRWLLSDVLITNKNTNEEGEPLADGEREALSLTEETAKDFYHWGYREDVGALRQLGTGASALARQELNAIGQEMEKKKASGTRKRDRFYSGAAGRTLFDGALDYASAGIEAARRATVTAWDTTKNLAIGRAGSSSDNDLREKLSKARDYAEQEHLRTRIVPKFLKWLYVDVIQTRWRKKYLHVHQKKIADNVKGCEPVLLKIFQDVSPEEETGIFLKRAMGRDEKKMETPY
eukprot:g19418.t1